MRKGGLYLAIGDSTTYNKVTDGANLYPSKVQSHIADTYGQVQLVNLGWSGQTSNNAVIAIKRQGGFLAPDMVTIGLGMNDFILTPTNPTSDATYIANLKYLVDWFRKQNPNVEVVLCTPNTISSTNGYSVSDSGLSGYRTDCDTLAAEYTSGVHVAHFENAWTTTGGSADLNSDGIHPNDTGHPLLANIINTIVDQMGWVKNLA